MYSLNVFFFVFKNQENFIHYMFNKLKTPFVIIFPKVYDGFFK